jgi:hypothetical protein
MSEKVAMLKLYAGKDDCVIVHLMHLKKILTCLAKFLDVSDIYIYIYI